MIEDDTTTETPAVVAPEAPPEAPPASAKLTVKRVKSAAPVIAVAKEDADASVAPEGTRMETDAGPVQGTNLQAEPREIEELEFPGLTIIRQRF